MPAVGACPETLAVAVATVTGPWLSAQASSGESGYSSERHLFMPGAHACEFHADVELAFLCAAVGHGDCRPFAPAGAFGGEGDRECLRQPWVVES